MNSDDSAMVMITDRAAHAASDNNAAGDPRTVVVDISALSNFSSALSITIDANTNAANGQSPVTLAFSPQMTITLGGYSVTFLTLKPRPPKFSRSLVAHPLGIRREKFSRENIPSGRGTVRIWQQLPTDGCILPAAA